MILRPRRFRLPSLCRVSNCSRRLSPSPISASRSTWSTSARFRVGQCPIWPVGWSTSPRSRCLSAASLRFLDHPAPAGALGLPHGWLTLSCETPSGFLRSARWRDDGGGCPLYADPDRVSHVRGLRFQTLPGEWVAPPVPGPSRRLDHHHPASHRHDASSGIHSRSPVPSSPHPGSRRSGRLPFGRVPELRTQPLPAAHIRAGDRPGHWSGLRSKRSHSMQATYESQYPDDGVAFFERFFRRAGQRSSCQRRMASSSRCVARWVGCCRLHPA